MIPRALPWALDLLGFQPVQGRRQGFFRTISTYLIFLDFEHPNGQRDLFLSNGEGAITTILNTYLPTCTWKNCCITFGNTDCCLQRL